MSHLYEGAPDARQSDSVETKVSRFRSAYRALTDEEKALHDEIKSQATQLEALFDRVHPTPTRYKQLAITALEESVMWIVKELTSSK